jgi:lactate dehydrogenase-like 2-hydroxyacid dehydrogenase
MLIIVKAPARALKTGRDDVAAGDVWKKQEW